MNFFGTGWSRNSAWQDMQLREQRRDISRVERTNADVRRDNERMVADFERLHLATAAMWELIGERLGLDDSDLIEKMREIDLRDGVEDGRVRPQPRACPSCDRPNHGRRPACIYCGHEVVPPPLG